MNKDNNFKISIIGPSYNEEGNLKEFVERCFLGFKKADVNGEIIIVDDGSTDESRELLEKLSDTYGEDLKVYLHRSNFGLTEALSTGFSNATGDYLIWISVDLESYPDDDIPKFVEGFREGYDVVAGSRIGRNDGKNLASKIYNLFCKKLFKIDLRDMNWTKGFHKGCLEFLHLRGDWHRFIMVMLHVEGFSIVEKDMDWHERKYGKSNFGISRFPKSIVDAISIWFLLKFSKRPMRLFGFLGLFTLILGFSIHVFLVVYYLLGYGQIRPLFWTAIALELSFIQLIFIGFIAELVEINKAKSGKINRGNKILLKKQVSKST